jgi:hypothetical protein
MGVISSVPHRPDRVSLMRKPWVKWSLILCGVVFLLLLAGFSWLVFDFSGHSKSRLIRETTSPDGRFVAEVREVITPMHGGPDSVQVMLRPATHAVGDVVYSQTFECGPDYSAFQIEWQSPANLTVSSGTCDAGRYRSAGDNNVFQRSTTWQGVSINYRDSGHVAHSKP